MFTMCHYEREKKHKKMKKQKTKKTTPEWAVDNCFGGSS